MLLEQLRADDPEPPVIVAGVSVHVRPLGVDVWESPTVPVNPLIGVTVMLKLAV